MAFLLVGLGFKVSAVPFQWWTPDVYQGAPTPATGFMAAAAKAAGFAALLRIFFSALPTQAENWRPLVWVLAALTLVVGAVLAVVQSDVKRMLAYSSMNHAGYVLLGLQAATATGSIATNGLAGSAYYLLAYTFMVAGSFAVGDRRRGQGRQPPRARGLPGSGLERPALALAFTILLVSQAGIPFTVGFIAKFNVISAVWPTAARPTTSSAVIAMLAAAVSVSFYLRIILAMYTTPDEHAEDGSDGGGTATLVRTRPITVTGDDGHRHRRLRRLHRRLRDLPGPHDPLRGEGRAAVLRGRQRFGGPRTPSLG